MSQETAMLWLVFLPEGSKIWISLTCHYSCLRHWPLGMNFLSIELCIAKSKENLILVDKKITRIDFSGLHITINLPTRKIAVCDTGEAISFVWALGREYYGTTKYYWKPRFWFMLRVVDSCIGRYFVRLSKQITSIKFSYWLL